MKKVNGFLFLVFFALSGLAQIPQKMSYQAVIRSSTGQLVIDHAIGMRISILRDSESGTPVYVETHTPSTNANGLVTIEIGNGNVITGSFEGIDWSTGMYFIKTETDPEGGTNYTITGTCQILSVPYALYSKTSGTSKDADSFNQRIRILEDNLIASGNYKLSDIDGNQYDIVKIGTQVWMRENLKTTKYRNGDLIGTTNPPTLDISSESTPKYQWAYDAMESNVSVYGRLYTWYAAADNRNICPVGWHLPSDVEWTTLTNYLTNNGYGWGGSGNLIGKSMASTSGWNQFNYEGTIGNDQSSNNSSGFSAIASGYHNPNGNSYYAGEWGNWWSATEYSSDYANEVGMHYSGSVVTRSDLEKKNGISVRCLKD